MENNEAIILRIRELMDYLSLNQNEFSKACGIEQANLSAILSGRRKIGTAVVNKILLTFQINKEWLLEGTGERFRINAARDMQNAYGQKVQNETNVYDAVRTLSQSNKELVEMFRQVMEDKRALEGKLCDLVEKVISK